MGSRDCTTQKCRHVCLLALWDKCDRSLHLARDRFGEKPLYWGHSGFGGSRCLLFGSDLNALRAWPGFNNQIDRAALAQFSVLCCLRTYNYLCRYPAKVLQTSHFI